MALASIAMRAVEIYNSHVKLPQIEHTVVVSQLFEENAYIAWRPGRADCLIVDPGLEPEAIVQQLHQRQLVPAAILNTHGHADHIAGNATLKHLWPHVPLMIGRGDAPMLTDPVLNLSAQFGFAISSPTADRLLGDGDLLHVAGFELLVREIPGHSPGHVVFICQQDRPLVVFGGDVLFAGSVGRTDLPGGSFSQLAKGIHAKLFCLPADTIVLPGHGPPTTIGHEQQTNPFVGRSAFRG